ncbi:MAG: diguanylate cyclase and phosphoesterase, partial [Firmicutes bacterium]|nr:diguanylate cyclase and phosphoesterase [Bacillota bacterium]
MPRNSSVWVDIRIHLVVVVGLLLVIMIYNKYVAFIGLILLISLFVYGRQRCNDRQQEL